MPGPRGARQARRFSSVAGRVIHVTRGSGIGMAEDKRRVVMSGYPGSGKSTLAAALAERLGFSLISKDAMLMTLYTAFQFEPGDHAAPLRTGAAAWSVFWMQAAASPRAVLDTNIQFADPQQIEALRSLGGTLVEVRCERPPGLAKARFATRASIGHPAQRHMELDDGRLALYAQPIGIGDIIRVELGRPDRPGRGGAAGSPQAWPLSGRDELRRRGSRVRSGRASPRLSLRRAWRRLRASCAWPPLRGGCRRRARGG